ncbi:MAG: radical SAM protein [Patescibacteria group bacterium]|jgi:radical SAM protein with 4Fe4S-binding SPASM domain
MNRYILRKENFGGLLYDRQTHKIEALNRAEFDLRRKTLTATDLFLNDNKNYSTLSAPIRVFLVLTRKCNLSCKHCSNNSGPIRKEKLSYRQVESIISQLKSLGVFEIAINGGEPLCHPDFFEIVKLIKRFGFPIYLNTNGVCQGENLEKLAKAGIEKIKVSLDGLEKHHDYIRGKGVFKIAIQTIRRLKETGNNVRINFTINRDNLNDCLFLIKLSDDLRCDLKIAPMVNVGRAKDLNQPAFTPKETDLMSRQVTNFCRMNNIQINVEFVIPSQPTDCQEISLKWNYQFTECGVRHNFCSIESNGDFINTSLQTEFEKYTPVGNINQKQIADLWEKIKKENESLRQGIDKCKNCDVNNFIIKSFNDLSGKIWWGKI